MPLLQAWPLACVRMKNKEQTSPTAPANYTLLDEELRIFIIYSYMLTTLLIKSGEDM